jgi:hypothetical protein
MSARQLRRRRSDDEEFVQTEVDVDAVADGIFARYVGEQPIVIEDIPATATYFDPAYCPDLRVMKMAGRLAVAVNRQALQKRDTRDVKIAPLRVSVEEIMLAALLHDLGKHHEDCKPLLDLMRTRDLRGADDDDAAARKAHLLGIVRDVHCRKGPCMIDRLREAERPELNSPFIATVARRHGDDYEANRSAGTGIWWAREINVITIADDYDAITSSGPERAYKRKPITEEDAASLIRGGVAAGRYEATLAEIFLTEVAGTTGS